MTLLALLCHGTAHSALPPVLGNTAAPPAPASTAATAALASTATSATPALITPAEADDNSGLTWFLPPVRLGGSVTYNFRRDIYDGQSSRQSGLSTTLNASTNTYIWQPWFARVNGTLGFTRSSDSNTANRDVFNANGNSSKSVIVTGGGQLSLLAQSKFPFEAHFQRSDNRVSSNLALGNSYASERYGFTQRYFRPEGDALLGWDRNIQTSDTDGRDVQDSLQLRLSQRLDDHRLQLNGDRTTNKREQSGERAAQDNLALQHSYTPDPSMSVESLVNISRSDFRLLQGSNDSRLLQLTSNAFWRPQGDPLTVTGGVRMFGLETDNSGFGSSANTTSARLLNANANLGATYELNPFTRINGSANVNMTDSQSSNVVTATQTLGVNYQPAVIELGPIHYNWSTSANGSNRTGGDDPERQLTLQFSHNLGRSFRLAGGSTLAVDAGQSVAVTAGNNQNINGEPVATRQLTHSGSVSWDLTQDEGTALVRLSASDSRELDGQEEFFQLVNFQASSNLPTGRFSIWTGNFTIQSTRQGRKPGVSTTEFEKGFVTSSSGSISYQNQRLFGYRRLRFTSDLRLNSDALLPLFGSAADQELAAWDNRVDYAVGRTQLRLNFLISSSSSSTSGAVLVPGAENSQKMTKINKSIMFSVTRNFGDF